MKSDPIKPAEQSGPSVQRVRACQLTVTSAPWDYAVENQAAIATHWQDEVRNNPAYFNGPIFLLSDWSVTDDGFFEGAFLRTEFQAYLYWRSRNFEAAGVWDAFGSGVVRSADGAVLLGEQNAGHVNAGYSYPPSGFIDDQDVTGAQTINIDTSIGREIEEETGLSVAALERQSDYWITFHNAQISIAVVFDSGLESAALRQRVCQNLSQQPDPELATVHMVSAPADLAPLSLPPYAQHMLGALL